MTCGNIPGVVQLAGRCCGCLACVASCHFGALRAQEDDLGFAQPKLDSTRCTSCGACDRVCPALNDSAMDSVEGSYWCQSKKTSQLSNSSSGGVFGLLAADALELGGVVYGAAFADGYARVEHIRVDGAETLHRILTSKYVQSYVSPDLYPMVVSDLKDGMTVLFSGTSCQITALKRYLAGKKYDGSILLVDVMCHGVPSPLLWSSYVRYLEERVGDKLDSVNFRSKSSGWTTFSFRYTYRKEKVVEERHSENWYMKAFLKNASLRQSCFDCPSKRSCGSDVTLGDYWGFDSNGKEVDADKGVSAVIVHTPKGAMHLERIFGDTVYGAAAFEDISAKNPALEHSVVPFTKRQQFLDDVRSGMELGEVMRKWKFDRSFVQRVLGKAKSLWVREGDVRE